MPVDKKRVMKRTRKKLSTVIGGVALVAVGAHAEFFEEVSE
jgi:hypothetical protein